MIRLIILSRLIPGTSLGFSPWLRNRHQRRHIAPKVVAAEVPARAANPLLGASHVLDDHRNVVPSRFGRLTLNAETGIKKGSQLFPVAFAGLVIRFEGFGFAPRHGHVAVFLAGWRSDNQGGVFELRTVNGEHVLDYQLGGVFLIAVLVGFDVVADHIPAFREQTFRPASESAKQIDSDWQIRHGW